MNYPYVCTRVRARKGQLLKDDDYRKLVTLRSTADILAYLGKGPYQSDLVEIPGRLDNLELLHMATFRNYGRSAMEVYRMTADGFKGELYPLFMKLDMLNMLTVLRGKYGELTRQELEHLLVPAPTIKPRLLMNMYDSDSHSILRSFGQNLLLGGINPDMSHREIENRIYFNWLLMLKRLEKVKILKNFIQETLFVYDLMNLVKARVYGAPLNEFVSGRTTTFLKYQHQEDLFRAIQQTFDLGGVEPHELENQLETRLLRKGLRLMRMNPISAGPVVGFLQAKELEARNLRVIGFGVETGMSPADIRGELIHESGRGG
ncbi:MAG TPA: hypothetical protein ENN60_01940 [archaeon]|nr:hypothetical protein [archaeon]